MKIGHGSLGSEGDDHEVAYDYAVVVVRGSVTLHYQEHGNACTES